MRRTQLSMIEEYLKIKLNRNLVYLRVNSSCVIDGETVGSGANIVRSNIAKLTDETIFFYTVYEDKEDDSFEGVLEIKPSDLAILVATKKVQVLDSNSRTPDAEIEERVMKFNQK